VEDMCYEIRRQDCTELNSTICVQYGSFPQVNFPRKLYRDRNVWSIFICVCVCLLLHDLVQSCLRGEGGILEDMCYERRRAEASVD